MKLFDIFKAKDEREKALYNKFYAHGFWIIMSYLFIVIITKQIFLRMPLKQYAIEFSAFTIGAIYTGVRSIIAGQSISLRSKKFYLITWPLILSIITTGFVYIKSFPRYFSTIDTAQAITKLVETFSISLLFTFSIGFIVIILSKVRKKKIERKLEEENETV